jgi:hypothetical protein
VDKSRLVSSLPYLIGEQTNVAGSSVAADGFVQKRAELVMLGLEGDMAESRLNL